jgi:hypothetical protein
MQKQNKTDISDIKTAIVSIATTVFVLMMLSSAKELEVEDSENI